MRQRVGLSERHWLSLCFCARGRAHSVTKHARNGNILINQFDEAGQSCSRQLLLCLGAVRQLGKKEILKPAQPLAEPRLSRVVLEGLPAKPDEQLAGLPDCQRGANHSLLNEACLKAPAEFG